MIVKYDESGRIDTIDAEGRLYLECMDDDHYILLIKEGNTEHRVTFASRTTGYVDDTDTEIIVRLED